MIRVVLYAEGPGELAGPETRLPPPTETLPETTLGPGHVLVRRCLCTETDVPAEAVAFSSPLRDRRGRRATGSRLLSRPILRQVLSWPDPQRAPDLAVILVDRDGDRGRRALLQSYVAGLASMPVVAAAIEEFEAWLVADHAAAAAALGKPLSQPKSPEAMSPHAAKELWAEWLAGRDHEAQLALRRRLAKECDLDELERLCPKGFGAFRKELRTRAAQLAGS